ncbi:hypothetical protein BKA60DRAFT_687031 [Fusarium oxysporum]|nr:hypothetical protein BKA60DRAFT_687031 [Fusarium oxysporum]
MPYKIHYAVALLLLFTPIGKADSGDDFSNNLFSDLAPLLALFGERVTMQFLSQTLGWADCVILAMAPLGVITTIVSAIRVEGPPWLKAIIGRSRENRSVAEMELMSSTSQETCELWNGDDVVRCQGLAPVKEFICLFPPNIPISEIKRVRITRLEDEEANPNGLMKRQEPQANGVAQALRALERKVNNFWIGFWSRTRSMDVEAPVSISLQHLAQEDNGQQKPEPEMVILRNTETQAPNITLNRHNKVTRRHLFIAAVFGSTIQLGVLIYFGLISYYYPSKFKRAEKAVLGYAFPFSATGTVLLVTGTFLCAHVVDRSTNEVIYEPTQGYVAKVVWLQSKQTVSDQVFRSFDLYPQECPQTITTSQRSGPMDESKGKRGSTSEYKSLPINLSVVGTGISLAGFFIQFIGLRAMHWSASVGQLITIFIMTVVRAFVRRGFTARIHDVQLREKFELDELAMALGNPDSRLDSGSTDGEPVFDFGLSKGGSWTVMMNEDKSPENPSDDSSQASSINTPGTRAKSTDTSMPPAESTMIRTNNIAQDILQLRTKLAQLADWRGPASTEATQLAEAIEATIDSLCPKEGPDLFSWTINVKVLDEKGLDKILPVVLQLKRNEGHWKCRVDELDSVLSLWLCSVDKKRHVSTGNLDDSGSKRPLQMDNDAWFRKKSSETRGGLVLIGQQTNELGRCLKWWMPTDWSYQVSIENDETLANWDLWRVLGAKRTGYSKGEAATRSLKNSISNSNLENNSSSEDPSDDSSRSSSRSSLSSDQVLSFLAIQSHESLESLYAKHIFYAFIWAAVERMDKAIHYHPELDSSSPVDSGDWSTLRLQCTSLSKLARSIQTSGLMDLHNSYLVLIPPLHYYARLGELNCVVQIMSMKAKDHERLLNWTAAAECYQQLFYLANYFRVDSYIYTKSVAMMVEYVRAIYDLQHSVLQAETERFKEAWKAAKSLSSLLRQKADPQILDSLRNLYSFQSVERHAWSGSALFPSTQNQLSINNEETKYCSLTELHRQIARSRKDSNGNDSSSAQQEGKDAAIGLPSTLRQYVNTPDILGWTPLHYAASIYDEGAEVWIRRLIKEGADANARDIRDYTPLHYCLLHGNGLAIEALLAGGANVRAVGVDGMTPLHCYAFAQSYMGLENLLFNPIHAADQFSTDNLGRAPIHLVALVHNNDAVPELRLSIGARDKEGRTALHLAVLSGNWGTVSVLAFYGANLDELTGTEETVLDFAVRGGNIEDVGQLLRLGATASTSGIAGWTPLHSACTQRRKDIIHLLIQNGADVNAVTETKETPIMLAAEKGFSKIVNLLLKTTKVELDHRNMLPGEHNYNYTALDMAVEIGKADIVRRLIERGAIIDEQTLRIAKESNKDLSVAQFVRKAYSLENCVRNHIQGEGAEIVWNTLRRALLEREEEYVPWALFAGLTGTSFCFL